MSGNELKIGIIGCGNMGSSFAKMLAPHHHVYLSSKNAEKSSKIASECNAYALKDNGELAEQSDIIILAVKPQDIGKIAIDIKHKLNSSKLLISILAGTTVATLEQHFNQASLLRMMPNMAIRTGSGVIGLAENQKLSQEWKDKVETVLKPLGYLVWLPEDKIDALSSLTASGPAFILVMIESMADAAIAMGFKPHQALELVQYTLKGTLDLLRESGGHPAELKWQICSPAGTTIEGLKQMEKDGVRSGIIRTFLATYERNKQLGLK